MIFGEIQQSINDSTAYTSRNLSKNQSTYFQKTYWQENMEIHDLKKHISKGKTELVIETLLLNLKGLDSLKDVYNQIILLSSKYQLLKHDQLLNNTSHTDIELAKLNSSILEILDMLSETNINIVQSNVDYELYESRDQAFGRGYDKWLDILSNAKEVVAINGIPRFFWDNARQDVITRKRIKDLFGSNRLEKFTIIWDMPFAQAYRYYVLKSENEYYSQDDEMELNRHVYDKSLKPIKQIRELIQKYPKIQLKLLPFSISYTILRADNEIYVVLLGATKGNQSPIIKLIPNNTLLFNHFNNFINYLLKTEAVPEIDAEKNEKHDLPEFLQIVDKDGGLLLPYSKRFVEKQNRSVAKAFKNDFVHRHIYCLILSKANKILIQKRSKNYDNPNLWDKSVGGHVTYSETTVQACIREIKEELGIQYDPMLHDLIAIFQQSIPEENTRIMIQPLEEVIENKVFELFLLKNIDENEIKIDQDETVEVQWKTLAELKEFINLNHVTSDLKQIINNSHIVNIINRHIE